MTIPSYSKNNPQPTAVIREMRYMVRNAMVVLCADCKLVRRDRIDQRFACHGRREI